MERNFLIILFVTQKKVRLKECGDGYSGRKMGWLTDKMSTDKVGQQIKWSTE